MLATLSRERAEGRSSVWTAAAVAALLALGLGASRGNPAARAPPERWSEGTPGKAAPTARDWKAIARRIREDLTKRRIIAIAAGVTFYSLLAIVPAIAALVALYGLFADPTTIAKHLDNLSSFVPGGAIEIIGDQITRIAAQSARTLGLTFFVGLLISLWSANGGVKAMFDALNVVYGVDERRGFARLNAVSLAFVIGGIAFALFAIGAMVALPPVLDGLGLGIETKLVASIGRWPVLFLAMALVLAFVYRFGPDRANPRWRWITWGSALASLAWLAASLLFSWYAANFGSYNKTYGSLGALIGFMTWIWISAIVVLMGAEFDSAMEQPEPIRDAGAPRPALQGSS